MTLILASTSPRRRDLLTLAGLSFSVHPSDESERPPRTHEPAQEYVQELSRGKARSVVKHHPGDIVLAADTVVTIDDDILGKPASADAARRMLALLRGRTNVVATGITLLYRNLEFQRVVTAQVAMRPYRDDDIDEYIRTGEPLDKAGAYAIQGVGGQLVAQISGCYTTVVGLPLCTTVRLLHEVGAARGVADAGWCAYCRQEP